MYIYNIYIYIYIYIQSEKVVLCTNHIHHIVPLYLCIFTSKTKTHTCGARDSVHTFTTPFDAHDCWRLPREKTLLHHFVNH